MSDRFKHCSNCGTPYDFNLGECPKCRSVYWKRKKEGTDMSTDLTGANIIDQADELRTALRDLAKTVADARGDKNKDPKEIIKMADQDARYPIKLMVQEYRKLEREYIDLRSTTFTGRITKWEI